MQTEDQNTAIPNPISFPITAHSAEQDQQNNLEDLSGDQTESFLSNPNPPPSFFQRNKPKIKKFSLISLIAIIIILVIVLPIVLTTKSSSENNGYLNPTVLFQRSFKQFDTFHYVKNGNVCAQPSTAVDNTNPICQSLSSNFSFHVSNVRDSKEVFPNETNDNFKVISVMLHLKSLVFENETHTFNVGGATFSFVNSTTTTRRILNRRKLNDNNENKNNSIDNNNKTDNNTNNETNNNGRFNINDSNFTQSLPLIKAEIFDNGTIYKVFRPKNLSQIEWDHMKEILTEFSPILTKKLYHKDSPPNIQQNLFDNNKDSNTNHNNTNNNESDSIYYESHGTSFVSPTFNYTHDENLMRLNKSLEKNSFISLSLPENSNYSSLYISHLNKSTGFLDASFVNSSSHFERSEVPDLQPEDNTDYFLPKDMRQPRFQTNFSAHNYYQNSGTGSIKTNSTTQMILSNYVPDDKNTTIILETLANETEFEEIPLKTYVKNQTYEAQMKFWQEKLKPHLDEHGNIKKKSERLLFNTNSIEEMRQKLSEIVYPVFQIDFHGWKSKLLIILDIQPYENKIKFEIVLNIEGVFNAALVSKEYPVQLSDSIDHMIAFIYKAYNYIQDLANKFENILKYDLGSKIEKYFSEIQSLIEMPFDIEKIFSSSFSNLSSEILKNIDTFLKNIANIVSNNLFCLQNPLQNYTDDLMKRVELDTLVFLGDCDNSVTTFQNSLKNEFDQLYQLAINTTNIFPDLIEDVRAVETMLVVGFNKIPQILADLMNNDYLQQLNTLISALKDLMRMKYKGLMDSLKNSGFSKGLSQNISVIQQKIANSFEQIENWLNKLLNNFSSKLANGANVMFSDVNKTAFDLIDSLNSQLENLADFLHNKTLKFVDLKKYELAFDNFLKIHENFIEFRYRNFSQYFELPLALESVMGKSLDYLEIFYGNYTNIENFARNFFNSLKDTVETCIYNSIQAIKHYNYIVNYEVLDKNIGFFQQDLLISIKEISNKYSQILTKKFSEISLEILPNIFKSIEKISKQAFIQNNNSKIVFCQEERSSIENLLNTFAEIIQTYETDAKNYYEEILNNLKSDILGNIPSEQIENLTQVLILQNNITLNSTISNELLIELPLNSSEITINLSNLFSEIVNISINDLKTNIDEGLYDMRNNLSLFINESFNNLTNFIDLVQCSAKNLTNDKPLQSSFCVVYNLTSNILNASPLTIQLKSSCIYEDELKVYINNLNNSIPFMKFPSEKMGILIKNNLQSTNSKMIKIMNVLNESKTNISLLQSSNIFNNLNDNFYELLELEIKTMNDFLFSNLDEITNNFSNSINNSTNKILSAFGQNLLDLKSFIDNNFNSTEQFSLPDFLYSNILAHYNNIKNEAQGLVNNLKQDATEKFSFLLSQFSLLHQINNKISLNYLKELANEIIPFSISPMISQCFNSLETQLNNFYGNTTQIRNTLVSTINNRLYVNYDKFAESYQQIVLQLDQITLNAANIIEDIQKNASSSFEFNSYEKIKDFRKIYDTANNGFQGLNEQFVEGNLVLMNKIIDKNFEIFNERFSSYLQIFNQTSNRFSGTLTNNFAILLGEVSLQITNFPLNDDSLVAQILNYSQLFNQSIIGEMIDFENNFNEKINIWLNELKNDTETTLSNYNRSLTNKTLKYIQDFQTNILIRASQSFNEMISSIQSIFYAKVSEFKTFLKSDYLNKTLLNFNNFATSTKTIANFESSILEFDQKINDFKGILFNKLDLALETSFSNIFDKASQFIESFSLNAQTFYNGIQANLMKNLLEIQQNLEISYNIYSNIPFIRSNYTDFIENQAMAFTNDYFDILQNSTKKFENIMKIANSENFLTTHVDINKNESNIKNISYFSDISYQMEIINQYFNLCSKEILNMMNDFNETISEITIDKKAEKLEKLIINQINSIIEPSQLFLISNDYLNLYKENLNSSIDNIMNLINEGIIDIYDYVNKLFNSTGQSSLHITIMIDYYRKLKLDPIQSVFLQKIDDLMQNIYSYSTNSFYKIQNSFINNINKLNQTILSQNSLENEIFYNKVNEIITNETLLPQIFSQQISQQVNNLNSTILPNNFKTYIQNNFNISFNKANELFNSLVSSLKQKIQPLINELTSQNQLYLKMIENINSIQNFRFKSFNLSQIIYDNVNKFQQIFENQINNFVNGFISFLNPLNTLTDNLIDDFEEFIEKVQIKDIVEKNVLIPLEDFREEILQTCENLLDELTDKIIDMANNLLETNNDNNAKSLRLLQPLDIAQLEDAINFFNNIIENSVNFIQNLHLISDVINTYKSFKMLFDGSLVKIIKNLGNNLVIFSEKADEKMINYIKQSINNKILRIDSFVQQEMSSVNDLIASCISVFRSFSWASLKQDLLRIVYKERDKLINFLLSKLVNFSFNYGDGYGNTLDYAITIPIGPVPLTFEFAFNWNIFYQIGAGLNGFNIFVFLKVGASSDVTASAGVGLPCLQVMGYIRGVIAKGEGDFTINYALVNLNADIKLCFSISFGELTVGVATKAYIPINKLVCWVQRVAKSICRHIPFIGSLCDKIFDFINVCKWVSSMEWTLWIDFFPPIKLISPHVTHWCPWQKQLG